MRHAPFRSSALACALLLGAASACVTIGEPFPATEVPRIEIGVTTQDDLTEMFGAPYRKGYDDGDRTWTWVHYRLALIGATRSRDLYVRFDSTGRVASYSFNTNFPEDEEPGAR